MMHCADIFVDISPPYCHIFFEKKDYQGLILTTAKKRKGKRIKKRKGSQKQPDRKAANKKLSRKSLKPLLYSSLFVILTTFILLEIILRFVFPVPEVLNFNRINYAVTRITPQLKGKKHISNVALTWISAPDKIKSTSNLNIYGFRDKDWSVSKDTHKKRVMFIGDSFLEGLTVSDENTLTEVFSRAAKKNNIPIETMNLGILATRIPYYFVLIRDAVPLFKPDNLFLVLYANDFPPPPLLDSWNKNPLKPIFSNAWKPRIFHILSKYSDKQPIPRRWISSTFPILAPIPYKENPWSHPKRAKEYEKFVDPELADLMKKALFNPHAAREYDLYKKNLKISFEFRPYLRALKNYLGKFHTKLWVAYIPSSCQVSDRFLVYKTKYAKNKEAISSLMTEKYQIQPQIIGGACKQLNIPFVDLTPILRQKEKNGSKMYWNYDEHLTADGYKVVGEELFKLFNNYSDEH